MIDVTHNADDRRSGNHLVIGVLDVILYELGDDIDAACGQLRLAEKG